MFVLDLDSEARAHLRHALMLHQAWCSRNAVPFPRLLRALLGVLSASNGQERTEIGDGVADRDDGGVEGLLQVEQVARRLNVSVRQVRRLLASGDLPSLKVGSGARRIAVDDVENYVEARKEVRSAG